MSSSRRKVLMKNRQQALQTPVQPEPVIVEGRTPERLPLIEIEEKETIGFWHICMINNYFEIISEQLNLLLESGLYDKAEYIYAGCSGGPKELEKVKQLFSNHEKIKVSQISNIKNFEFPTLEHFKHIVEIRPDFFAFYIHTKGVSYPTNEGGKHWRDYMNYYTITRWKDNVGKLMEGYDTCGVKLIPKGAFPLHYSGNFWWANTGYVKTLPPINSLNKQDRFQAEMWICGNNPITATLCQKFVDYNTKGKFIPEKSRIVVHTLAYNLTTEVREATRLLYKQNANADFEHVIVDLGFPLVEGDKIPENIDKAKLMNAQENINTAIDYNSQFMSVRNEGVSQNWNMAFKQMKIANDDVLICADPDERPKNDGWLKAVKDVIVHGPNVAWCSLMMQEHLTYFQNSKRINIAGHNVYILSGSLNWAQGGFSGKFLNEIGGVPVPVGAPIYGWIESACSEKMKKGKYVVAVLADYFVEHTECSTLYREWKTDVTSNVKLGQVDFEIWLRRRQSLSPNV